MGKYEGLKARLKSLYVWPQSVADHYADTLTPRQIKHLYEVGFVADEAATAITALETELAAMKARGDRLAEALEASRDWLAAENGNEAVALSRLEARIGQALTEWRDE